jgi:hypothetical protein
VDKRIGSITKEINVDRLMKLIDKKMSKEEVMMRIENMDQKVTRVEKLIKTSDNNASRLEVSHYLIQKIVSC